MVVFCAASLILGISSCNEAIISAFAILEDYLRILLKMPPTSCASSGSCGHYLTVEGDGSLYPCDFYVLDEWKLGDLSRCTVEDALDSPTSQTFLAQGRKRPAECAACAYQLLCRGRMQARLGCLWKQPLLRSV